MQIIGTPRMALDFSPRTRLPAPSARDRHPESLTLERIYRAAEADAVARI